MWLSDVMWFAEAGRLLAAAPPPDVRKVYDLPREQCSFGATPPFVPIDYSM